MHANATDLSGVANSNNAVMLPTNFGPFGQKIYCQNDEDGIIHAIFDHIGCANKFAVEFGIGPHYLDREYRNSLEGNTVILREKKWDVLMMDGRKHPERFDVKQHFITASNINQIFQQYNVPVDVDLISIDVDGQDYWIWKFLDYKARVFIVEYNPNFHWINQKLTIPYMENHVWDGTKYYGASFGAMVALGEKKGYVAVYANGVNIFFVRADLVKNRDQFIPEKIMRTHDQHAEDHLNRPWVVLD
jgi:hypothetical protein